VELLRLSRRIRAARQADIDFDWLTQLVSPRRFADKEVLFRKGDRPDNLYYVVSGTVRLSEADISLGAGEFLGEIAFFTDAKERTLTAVCDGPCEIVPINESTFMRLYYQNPAFGVYIVRLISRRLLQGMREMPQAYTSVVKTV
jgi:CRP-like cAMP-binding protein